jgi:peroxiredoxin
MNMFKLVYISIFLLGAIATQAQSNLRPTQGIWRGEIIHIGGALPMNFEVKAGSTTNRFQIQLRNGSERFSLGESYFRGDSLVIPFDLYESELIGKLTKPNQLTGYLVKKRNGIPAYRMPFQAIAGSAERFTKLLPAKVNVQGKWMADFWSDETNHSPGVGVFTQKGNQVTGTFLKTSGDYRYLQGNISGDSLFLSNFDGSYLMQVRARIQGKTLTGTFYSGLTGIRNLKAVWDPKAALPDLKKLTYLKAGFDRINFRLPTTRGEEISLLDERFKNKVVVIELMGSWCPNCIDESRFLAPYYRKNKDKGVEVIGLAFEASSDLSVAKPKIESFIKRVGIDYPILFAGDTQEETITKVLPMLHKINGYPTTFIIDKKGIVREIHTGFSGPSTGAYYADWTQEFDKTIQTLLKEKE